MGIGAELAALVSGRYPAFVTGDPGDSPPTLPVFTFHTLEPGDFEAKLHHLKRNDYQTISLDEAVSWLQGEAKLPARAVALTIDDGRLSTWTIGYPLLKKYGMIATAYVIPGYVEDGPSRPTLEDASWPIGEQGQATDEAHDCRTFMHWSEIERLHDSGVIAVESHTMLHREVVVSPRLRGFITPAEGWRTPYDLPLPLAALEGWSAGQLAESHGAPIFHSAPVLSRRTALRPPADLVADCVELVRREGREAFFERRDWERRLRNVVARHRRATFDEVPLEDLQVWELSQARSLLESRLTDKRVRHLSLPKGVGSQAVARLARDTGHRSAVWGLLDRRANSPGHSPFAISRLKHDYVFRLPGEGRHSLARVVVSKARRRARGDTGF